MPIINSQDLDPQELPSVNPASQDVTVVHHLSHNPYTMRTGQVINPLQITRSAVSVTVPEEGSYWGAEAIANVHAYAEGTVNPEIASEVVVNDNPRWTSILDGIAPLPEIPATATYFHWNVEPGTERPLTINEAHPVAEGNNGITFTTGHRGMQELNAVLQDQSMNLWKKYGKMYVAKPKEDYLADHLKLLPASTEALPDTDWSF